MTRKSIVEYWRIPLDRVKLIRAESFTHSGGTRIHFREYPILKYTACGAWVSDYGFERFVNLRAVKQFASTTKGEALDQLKHRKRRQIQIIRHQLENAEKTLTLIDNGLTESTTYSDVEFY
jgi:hypothetical protein